jgi:D-2-hydroxyacid dehydrogenase (NADP+)
LLRRYIQSIGVGYNQFPLEELQKRGIVLCNAVGVNPRSPQKCYHHNPISLCAHEARVGPLPQVNSPAVAEHALALMLSVSRKIFEARDNQHKNHWRPYISDPTAREFELRDKTIGVVGLGAIGEGVARLCKAFGCHVIGTKANPNTYPSDGAADRALPAVGGLDTLLAESDFLVLTCPLSDETEGLIGNKELSAMKPSSTLINCSRGPVVVESDLIASLKAGEIAAVRPHSRLSCAGTRSTHAC